MRKTVLAVIMLLATTPLAAADTIYLKNGRTVQGTVLGFINNRFAVRVNVRALAPGTTARPGDEGEIQFFRPADIDRIEIDGRSLDDLRYDARTVEVTLAANWIDSGIDLRRNERVQIRATGTILAGRSRITPDGLRTSDPTAPLPRAAEGVLIGAIGNDPDAPVLELGLAREFIADRDGRLYLTVNRGTYTDARGSYSVQVRRERDLSALNNDDPNNNSNNDDNNIFGGGRRTDSAPVRSRQPQPQPTPDTGRDRTPREAIVNVPGTSRGQDTGIDLRAGTQVTITATGRVIAGRRVGEVGPEGGRATGFGSIANQYPVPNAGPGALIGYLRLPDGQVSQAFFIGPQQTISVPADGRLFLAINDDNYSDNGGSFNVRVRY